jgi:hypothetical protein
VHPRDGQHDGKEREDGKAHVVHAHATEHVAQSAEAHDEHRGHEHVAHHEPEEVTRVARRQRIDLDASENVGQ